MGIGVEEHSMNKGLKERMKRGQEGTWWTRTLLTETWSLLSDNGGDPKSRAPF